MGGRTDSRGSSTPFLRFFRFLRRGGFPRLGSRERRERDFLLFFRIPKAAFPRRAPAQGSSRYPPPLRRKRKKRRKPGAHRTSSQTCRGRPPVCSTARPTLPSRSSRRSAASI